MDDIVMQIPHQDEDSGNWSLGSYWRYADDTLSFDSCTSGDHEDVDELPTEVEAAKAWIEYWKFVIDTDADPLGQLMPPSPVHENQRFSALIGIDREGPGGLRIHAIKRRWVHLAFGDAESPWGRSVTEAPEDIRLFLCLTDPQHPQIIQGVESFDALQDAIIRNRVDARLHRSKVYVGYYVMHFTIPRRIDRKPSPGHFRNQAFAKLATEERWLTDLASAAA